MDKKNIIICRCEDVTLQHIHDLLDQGYTSFEDMKRLCRIGMGPCQANTCGHLAQREIAKHLNVPVEDVPVHKVRPLIMGVPLQALVEEDDHEN
ncbi:MAG: (2Fe-2S)-binding protein [Acholeplasmataceae bacterium]|nr:MAG: (2Fe-2S)-binding protein [Acholeplasmataceae bacterium]